MKERIFIGSDFHGHGDVYFNLVEYLDMLQISNPNEKIVLYINGDIIDRGKDSMRMLLDVMGRVKGQIGNIEVHMMAGNHELIMYEAIRARKNGKWVECSWLYPSNGGHETRIEFEKLDEKKQLEVVKFLRSLPISVKFDGSIIGKDGIILAHACPPKVMKDLKECHYNLAFAYVDDEISDCLWLRKKDLTDGETLGIKDNLVIVGHTKNDSKEGYLYDEEAGVLNIDGGCADGDRKDLVVPIVEINYNTGKINMIGFDGSGKIKYRKEFASDGQVKNSSCDLSSVGGKYCDQNNRFLDLLEGMAHLADTKIDEFVSFVNENKKKLAALGLLASGLGAFAANKSSDNSSLKSSVSTCQASNNDFIIVQIDDSLVDKAIFDEDDDVKIYTRSFK